MKSNNLAKMIGKRVVQSCITILLVTLFVFALIQMVPGDPVANYLGATATEEQITYYRHLYGFRSSGHRPVSQLDRRPVPGHHGPVHQLSV